MYKVCSQEYMQFLEEYEKLLRQYAEASDKIVKIKTIQEGVNTEEIALLYDQAVEAHTAAINTFIRLLAIYKLLFQKWQEAIEKPV